MRNRIAQQRQRDYLERAIDSAAGRDRTVLSFTSESEVNQRIPDLSKLPAALNNTVLQRASDGAFYHYIGYSKIGGPDIIP